MKKRLLSFLLALAITTQMLAVTVSAAAVVGGSDNGDGTYRNAFIDADVPDLDIIRVGDAYYMSSTTMHMAPGVPIMKSYDLVNWETVSYCYLAMEDTANNKLQGTSHMYSNGTWASSLRYKNGTFYLVVPSQTSRKTYIFQTTDPENEPWKRYEINQQFHDCGLLMDDDGRNWLVWGNNGLYIIELNADVTGLAAGATQRQFVTASQLNDLIRDPVTGNVQNAGLREGAHIQKVNGQYYIFIITNGNSRNEVALRTSVPPANFTGTDFECKVVCQERISGEGPAQGGIVDDENGKWWGFVFRDSGPVGRAPWLMPITWEDGWPYFGQDANGKGSHTNLQRVGEKPVQGKEMKSVVASDEFNNTDPRPQYYDSPKPTRVDYVEGEYDDNGSNLNMAWQWNHNPDNRYWSMTERPGWMRLKAMLNKTASDRNLLNARNTLTQRTFGPQSGATTLLDVSNMKDGDEAGLTLFTAKYGSIGVKMEDGQKYLVTTLSNSWSSGHATNRGVESARIELEGDKIYLKAEGEFPLASLYTPQPARFYYSYDNRSWTKLGDDLNMAYSTGNHFMGYRFGLYNFAKTEEGGYADFDFFRLSDVNTGAVEPKTYSAFNPIVQTTYTADPAPLVYNDTVYLYTGQDLDRAVQANTYRMTDWKCYSSKDMVNWTDHGSVLDVTAFSWANQTQDANASQVIYNPKTEKFYYFVSVGGPGGIAVGVAVSDSPTGPFVDAIGAPLVTNADTNYATHSWDNLDPTVFIDDDGQAYLVWGNGACYWATLSEDMTSLTSEIGWYDIKDPAQFVDFTEGPWIYKRNGLYYLLYASSFPETISYSTSDSPTGPWTYRGIIMGRTGTTCSTIHPGVVDFKGESYYFYHKDGLPNQSANFLRATCVEKFKYNSDGTIPLIPMTNDGGIQILEYVNPYEKVEAETIKQAYPLLGLITEPRNPANPNNTVVEDWTVADWQTGLVLARINSGDYVQVGGVDFGDGAETFTASVSSISDAGTIELRLDSPTGKLVGTLKVPNTNGAYADLTTAVYGASDVHNLYLVFKGTGSDELFKMDYWQFSQEAANPLLKLQSMISLAQLVEETNYSSESWATFAAALQNAIAVAAMENPTDAQLNEAYNALSAGYNGLAYSNLYNLRVLLAKAVAADTTDWSNKDKAALTSAITTAQALSDENSSDSQAILAAISALESAMKGKVLDRYGIIPYGTPQLGEGVVDPLWDTVEGLYVDKHLTMASGPSSGIGKAMWDDENLYVMTTVTDPVLNNANSNDYQHDSVEIFVDEHNAKTASYGDGMGQYRVSYTNKKSFGSSTDSTGFESWTWTVDKGFVVLTKIPFKHASPGAGSEIGFDLQINDASASGSRQDVVMWFDLTGQSYADGTGWGTAQLIDKSALQTAYNENQGKEENSYTPNSWKAFKQALDTAADVLASTIATQTKIDDAKEALTAAADALKQFSVILSHPMDNQTAYSEVVDRYINRVNNYDDRRSPSYDIARQAMNYTTTGLWTSSGFKYDITDLVSEYPAGTEIELSMEVRSDAAFANMGFLYDSNTNANAGPAFTLTANQFNTITTTITLGSYNSNVYFYLYPGTPTVYVKNIVLGVASKVEPPVVDKTALKALYDANAGKQNIGYTADSWAAFQAAMTSAAQVLADNTATQNAVDAAVSKLQTAIDGLALEPGTPADKSALEALVRDASSLKESNYTAETWKVFKAALDDANVVMEKKDATQADVDAAIAALQSAMDSLAEEPGAPVDKSALEALISDASSLEESDYTAETWKVFKAALDDANAVLEKEGATQADVNAAVAALQAAKDALKETDPGQVIEVESIRITGSLTVKRNKTVKLTAVVNPTNATVQDITWTSLTPDVADVDENGVVTSTGSTGFAIIQAEANNGVIAQFTIRVTA
ncbi:family 43 glycosylhydrolase [Oscillospiraceae bacterium MB08-C2-2]|nr:family 43 glycosylhydrolase [Oscillospiraceae bacterium MB08-C2-2]